MRPDKGKQNGKTVEKSIFGMADPEGNGPGFLEINDGVEPEAPAYTEWCPNCSTEVAYKENKPFPCSTCGEILRRRIEKQLREKSITKLIDLTRRLT